MTLRPSDVIDAVTDFGTRYAAVQSQIEAVAQATPTADQLEAIRSGVAGLQEDARALLRDLDPIDEIGWLLVEDGERTLGLWRWRRDTRSAVVAFEGSLRRMAEIARDLGDGPRERVVVVRQGETWQSIAQRELGDWQEWPRLLAANPTLRVGALASGTTLVVPPKR